MLMLIGRACVSHVRAGYECLAVEGMGTLLTSSGISLIAAEADEALLQAAGCSVQGLRDHFPRHRWRIRGEGGVSSDLIIYGQR